MAKIDVPIEVVRQIAAQRARGVSLRDIETEFKLSRPVVNRVLDSQDAKDVMKGTQEDLISGAIALSRKECAELLPMTTAVLRRLLEKDSLKAVEIVLKASGILTPQTNDGGNKQLQGITVILPNTSPVTNEKEVISGN